MGKSTWKDSKKKMNQLICQGKHVGKKISQEKTKVEIEN